MSTDPGNSKRPARAVAPHPSVEDFVEKEGPGRRALRGATSVARATSSAAGRDLIKRSYYSPVPQVADLPAGTFERPSQAAGVDLDAEKQLDALERLAPAAAEFKPVPGYFDNPMYGPVDTEILYAMVRELRPRRIIELGSGFTSYVIATACEHGGTGRGSVDYVAYDPYPRPFLTRGDHAIPRVERVPATEIPDAAFAQLGSGDILFVDTTHTVKVGSEVNRIILEALPSLASGVVVHFHDIFLPFEYPREYLERHLFFGEQYLLQGFLAFNDGFEVACATHAAVRANPDRVRSLFPSAARASVPLSTASSFWIRRT